MDESQGHDLRQRAIRTLALGSLALLLLLVVVLFWRALSVLLLIFAGFLFGTALRGAAERLGSWTRLSPRWALLALVLVLLGLGTGLGIWLGPRIADQTSKLAEQIRSAVSTVSQKIPLDPGRSGQQVRTLLSGAAGVLSSAVGAIGSAVLVAFIAIYGAAQPETYQRGLLALVPPRRRERAGAILHEITRTLRRWLAGRLLSMGVVGVLTGLGLLILGIPLPVMLGLLAALLSFIPNLGPVISIIPALLLAAPLGMQKVLLVLGLYLLVQGLESYLFTPVVQRRAVSLPPALLISGQVVLGALAGILGLVFATPVLAAILVLTRELYIKSALGEDPSQSHKE